MGMTSKYKSKELYAILKKMGWKERQHLGLTIPPKKGWKKVIIKHKGLDKEIKEEKKKRKKFKEFYLSWEWKGLRYKVLNKYGRKCMCCGGEPPNVRLVVDHIKPRSKYPELEMDESNLQVLCNDCNMGKSNKCEKDFRGI